VKARGVTTPREAVRKPVAHGDDVDTLDFAPQASGRPTSLVAPTLTLLCHPDLAMVGAQAVLAFDRGVAQVSRLFPLFGVPASGEHRPIGDPHVSRRPLVLVRAGDALVLRPSGGPAGHHVGGAELVDSATVPWDDIQRGVVLRFGRHVAALLHAHPAVELGARHPALIGNSHLMTELRDRIARVARYDVPVLLQGESGVGKELIARALHDASPRAGRPFVAVNTGAIQSSLATWALFGHVKGSFTGATGDHDGFFARADGGTIFLDEIGELSSDQQSLLLRVLESGEIQRVGDRRSRTVDVRVIAATDRLDLESRLRAPLTQRLAGYRLQVPPLRERLDDLGVLLHHFLARELTRAGQRRPRRPAGRAGRGVRPPRRPPVRGQRARTDQRRTGPRHRRDRPPSPRGGGERSQRARPARGRAGGPTRRDRRPPAGADRRRRPPGCARPQRLADGRGGARPRHRAQLDLPAGRRLRADPQGR